MIEFLFLLKLSIFPLHSLIGILLNYGREEHWVEGLDPDTCSISMLARIPPPPAPKKRNHYQLWNSTFTRQKQQDESWGGKSKEQKAQEKKDEWKRVKEDEQLLELYKDKAKEEKEEFDKHVKLFGRPPKKQKTEKAVKKGKRQPFFKEVLFSFSFFFFLFFSSLFSSLSLFLSFSFS